MPLPALADLTAKRRGFPRQRHPLLPFAIAIAAALPGTVLRLAGVPLDPALAAATSGAAIVGASFLLLWACDAAQADVSQALALAVVAVLTVLPEYAVDMYFTWQAGQHEGTAYAQYAVANMTGANRLLIGVAWGLVAALYWWRFRRAVRIGHERCTELLFLGLATAYAFVIPIKGTLAWYDGLVFLGIYVWYIVLASRRPCAESEAVGPAEMLIRLPRRQRRAATAVLFLVAGAVILANAKPFCEGLIGTGRLLRINEFVLVQWLAPIASEAPEFIVALMFAWRGQAAMALGTLLSAKINQWTLLVGMIPGVYALSHGTLEHPIPMNGLQMQEILLTAAQSLLAVMLLASLRLSVSGGVLLFALFVGQLTLPGVVAAHPAAAFGLRPEHIHAIFSAFYIMAAVTLLLENPGKLRTLSRGLSLENDELPTLEPAGLASEDTEADLACGIPASAMEPRTPQCLECRWRRFGLRALRSKLQAARAR
jgi:cation:H+ antiporter